MSTVDPTLLAALSDTQVIAITIWGEARGEGIDGRLAVANVILNRVFANNPGFGNTLRGVCLKPAQFSCWASAGSATGEGVTNFTMVVATATNLLKPDPAIGPILKECLWIADGAARGQFTDNTHGSTHYITQTLFATKPPTWMAHAHVMARIGQHVFVRLDA